MAKSSLSTALIVGGVLGGAYLLLKKGGIADKIGEGIQSVTDSAGQIAQTVTDTAGSVAQTVGDLGGGIAQQFTDYSKKKVESGGQIGMTIGTIAEKTGLGSLITGDKTYKWTGFKWPF